MRPDEAAVMRQHLEEGCPQCAERYRFWQKVGGFIQDDLQVDPPPRPGSRSVRTAHLVFDTVAPAAEGAAAGIRHLLYEAPPFTIDLRIDARSEPEQLRLDGQIAEEGRRGGWPPEARVAVNTADAQLCTVNINELGEFQCHIARREDVSIAVTPREGELILMSLKVNR